MPTATLTTPADFTTNQVVNATDLNTMQNNIYFDQLRCACRVNRTVAQSITSGVTTAITFDVERYDTHSFHSTSVNTDRCTVPYNGLYMISFHVDCGTTGGLGIRTVGIEVDGSLVIAQQSIPASTSNAMTFSISTMIVLNASQYIRGLVTQNSGGAMNVNVSGLYSPELAVAKIGN